MKGEGTGLTGYDGDELCEGDTVQFMDGPYKDRTATIAWNPKGMWSIQWGDTINPYWITSPERLRVVPL